MTVYDLIVHMVSGLAVVGGRWEDMEVTLVTEDGKEQPLRVLFSGHARSRADAARLECGSDPGR